MSGSSPQATYAPWQFNAYTIAFEGNSIACILIGVYLTIAGANLYLLRRKRYGMLQLYTAVQLVITIIFFVAALSTTPSKSLGIFDITDASPVATSPAGSVIVDVAFALNTWLSDAFLLYRCYVICLGNRYALACPVLLYLAMVGSSLAFLVVSSTPGATYSTQVVHVTSICYWTCSAAMNVCASCFIAIRLWMLRQALSDAIGSYHGRFYLGYMAMTLESALLYTVFAIITLVVFALGSPLEFVFVPALGTVQVIVPSLIIYRIARGMSFETNGFGSEIVEMGSMQFMSIRASSVTMTQESDGADIKQNV